MVYRVYVAKKSEYAEESHGILSDIRTNLGITSVDGLRIFNRYDVEGLSKELFDKAVREVFSEPQVDDFYEELPSTPAPICQFAVEFLPGQFDQRADSGAQCIQFITGGERPVVKSAKVYAVYGKASDEDIAAIKKLLINPVESREAHMAMAKSLETEQPVPEKTPIIKGFISMKQVEFYDFIKEYSLSMDYEDLEFCQKYFRDTEKRDPTLTELKMIDTYWSDHCRHTTFMTQLYNIKIQDKNVRESFKKYLSLREAMEFSPERPITLMDMATVGAKYLSKTGKLRSLDKSEEINACSVKIDVDVDGEKQKWLLMFKNETHNHPTEIEPFGGAATCLGGAIRDPLSGRSYVYQAMRLTGAGNPLTPLTQTLEGKLPQITICRTAASGYSSYGNQIGLATGQVSEVYHDGFVAKRMEVGAVIGAVPSRSVVRKTPESGDVVILLGGPTGRDGVGGASGSSKAHDASSLESCGAEVQKGNPPEERKIQRLFRNSTVTRMIKRCNDFGAGGISVAIGELADGLIINLDTVPKKYEGLSGTELAISESQERMAVVVDRFDAQKFIKMANKENLSAVVVAKVTDKNRLEMYWQEEKIVDLCRDFLNSAGAVKQAEIEVPEFKAGENNPQPVGNLPEDWKNTMSGLNVASQRGLTERFDSTIGAGTVIMPFGGAYQATPNQAMAALIPVLKGETSTCSLMAWGYDPYLACENPYMGAYMAVISSVAKIVAAGGDLKKCWLSFQEYFERLRKDSTRWGKPFAALLGALEAQVALNLGAIGGKDSMSGSFEEIDVPPTLISFAVSVSDAKKVVTTEFKGAGNSLYLIEPKKDENGLYNPESLLKTYKLLGKAIENGKVLSAWAVGAGGICEAVTKMGMGNKIGVKIFDLPYNEFFEKKYGAIVIEAEGRIGFGKKIGSTSRFYTGCAYGETLELSDIFAAYEEKLEPVYKTKIQGAEPVKYNRINYTAQEHKLALVKNPQPKVLIPVFPGTNCEYDTARAFEKYGAKAEIFVVRNRTGAEVSESAKRLAQAIRTAQIIALPGGFSGGDEPDGSAKFIVSLLRNPKVAGEIMELINGRDGLMCGICNGFQALIKLGLVPYGEIREPSEKAPTLTFNSIGRHQSGLVKTRIASNKSPWLMHCQPGDIHTIAISHGEGRFVASDEVLKELVKNGQIATQYVDLKGAPTGDILFNPNNSALAIEGITSVDGRIFGKMGHSERMNEFLYKNIPDVAEQLMFKGAVDYYK